MRRTLALGMLALVLLPNAAQAQGPPQRIVSLNLCADQILLDLVPRARIKALSHLAADPSVSAGAEQARGIPAIRGEAEQVLAFDPDLVIVGTYSTPATVSLLERVGRRVVKIPLASDIDGIRTAIRQIAAAVGEADEGAKLISGFDRRLERTAVQSGSERPSALVYQVNGLASGTGSLADAVLTAAGFRNHARELGLGPGGTLALEALVANPPDLLILTGPVDEYRTAVAENLRHPALAALRQRIGSIVLPWRYWLCGTHHAAEAVERLATQRQPIGERSPSVRTPR